MIFKSCVSLQDFIFSNDLDTNSEISFPPLEYLLHSSSITEQILCLYTQEDHPKLSGS